MVGSEESVTWPEAIAFIGLLFFVLIFILGSFASYLEFRKVKATTAQTDDLRQLVRRYEQLAENTMDAQQRIATDVTELQARTASIEKILRTVE